MVSLCGLALSSLFVLNNKSVVHADVTQGNNAGAITWDSDQDDSAVVNQTQNASSTNSAQSDVQSDAKSVETSTVRSSSVNRPSVNQNNAKNSSVANDQSSRANLVSKVNDAEANKPVTITDPANNQVIVHYVNRNGGEINDPNIKQNVPISTSTTGRGSYQAPTGYTLNNPNGKYSVARPIVRDQEFTMQWNNANTGTNDDVSPYATDGTVNQFFNTIRSPSFDAGRDMTKTMKSLVSDSTTQEESQMLMQLLTNITDRYGAGKEIDASDLPYGNNNLPFDNVNDIDAFDLTVLPTGSVSRDVYSGVSGNLFVLFVANRNKDNPTSYDHTAVVIAPKNYTEFEPAWRFDDAIQGTNHKGTLIDMHDAFDNSPLPRFSEHVGVSAYFG